MSEAANPTAISFTGDAPREIMTLNDSAGTTANGADPEQHCQEVPRVSWESSSLPGAIRKRQSRDSNPKNAVEAIYRTRARRFAQNMLSADAMDVAVTTDPTE